MFFDDYMRKREEAAISFYQEKYGDLGFEKISDRFCKVEKRVNKQKTKILLNVNKSQMFLIPNDRYGLMVGDNEFVEVMKWQVFEIADCYQNDYTRNSYQVLLEKDYYKVITLDKDFDKFDPCLYECSNSNKHFSWEDVLEIAEKQNFGPITFFERR